MRVEAGYSGYVLGSALHNKNVIREALMRFPTEALLVLHPFTGLAKINGIKIQAAFPQFTILTPQPLSTTPHFTLEESVWVEAKPLPQPNSILILGDIPSEVAEAIEPTLATKPVKPKCVFLGLRSHVRINEYTLKYLNTPHIAILSEMRGVHNIRAEGEVVYLWVTHPLLTRLDLMKKSLKINLADIESLKRISLLMKPLIYVQDVVLVGELLHNNSVVLGGYLPELNELLIRGLLYVC